MFSFVEGGEGFTHPLVVEPASMFRDSGRLGIDALLTEQQQHRLPKLFVLLYDRRHRVGNITVTRWALRYALDHQRLHSFRDQSLATPKPAQHRLHRDT